MIPLLLQLGLTPQNCLKCKVHAMQVANTWRTTQDISLAIQATWGTVMDNLDGTTALARFAGPGAWNDADMLEVHAAILSHPVVRPEGSCLPRLWYLASRGSSASAAVARETEQETMPLALADAHSDTCRWDGPVGHCSVTQSRERTLHCGRS